MLSRQSDTKLSAPDRAYRNIQTVNYLQSTWKYSIDPNLDSQFVWDHGNGDLREITTRSSNKENYSRAKELLKITWHGKVSASNNYSANHVSRSEATSEQVRSDRCKVSYATSLLFQIKTSYGAIKILRFSVCFHSSASFIKQLVLKRVFSRNFNFHCFFKIAKNFKNIWCKGTGKRGHIVADTLLPMMFPGLRKLGNICCGHKMFLNKIRNIFCVPDTKFVSATNVARAGKRGNICVDNNVSATMCPRLPVP